MSPLSCQARASISKHLVEWNIIIVTSLDQWSEFESITGHWHLQPLPPPPFLPNGSCLVTYCNIYTVYTVFFLSLDLDGFIKHMLWEEVHEKSSLMQLSDRLLDSTSICVKYSLVEQAEKKQYETYRKI